MKKATGLVLLAIAAVGATGFSSVRSGTGPEAPPYSKVCVTRDASGNACGEDGYFFDGHGNLVTVVERLDPASPGFRDTDEMVRPVGPDGKAFAFQYDRTCTYGVERDAEGRRAEYRYDAQGNLASVTGTQAPFLYDHDARLVAVREDAHATR